MILRYSELLNGVFCKTHPWLAQNVVSRSAHVAEMLLAKASSAQRAIQGHY